MRVDDEAVKGGLLTGVEFDRLEQLLGEIEALSSYISLRRTDADEKAEMSRLSLISEKVKQVTRRYFVEAINARLARRNKIKGETEANFEIRALGDTKSELMCMLRESPKEAFDFLGVEYDIASLYNEAEEMVGEAENLKATKYAKKVLSRPPVVKEPVYGEAEAWADLSEQLEAKKKKESLLRERTELALKQFI